MPRCRTTTRRGDQAHQRLTQQILGLSNVSFGLPERKLLNEAFAIMAIGRGLDGAILNPMNKRLRRGLLIAETLAGKDEWCERYIEAYREGQLAL